MGNKITKILIAYRGETRSQRKPLIKLYSPAFLGVCLMRCFGFFFNFTEYCRLLLIHSIVCIVQSYIYSTAYISSDRLLFVHPEDTT